MSNEVEIHVSIHRQGDIDAIGEDIKRRYRKIGDGIRREFDDSGRRSGRGFMRHLVLGFGEMTAATARIARDFGNGMARSLSANPLLAAAVGVAVLAGIAAILPLIGAAIAGAVILGLGAGLAGVGIAFAAQSAQIKAEWSAVFKDIGREMRSISEPFEDTLSKTARFISRTFKALKPDLASAFEFLGPSTTKFFDTLGKSMEELGPAIRPVAQALNAILESLGSQFPGMMQDIADSITGVANSIKENPETFVMLIGWLKNIITFTLDAAAGLNIIAGWFERIPGFGQVIAGLGVAFKAAFAPALLVLDVLAALGQTGGGTKRAMMAVNQELHNNEEAAKAATKALKDYADEIRAQVDPLFAFGKAQREAHKAQKAFNKAVKEHGENSPEARKALEDIYRATLALAGATTDAGGATGRLSSKQRALLRSMGMTEGQIKALERRLQQLRHQLFLTELRAARAMRDRRAVYTVVFKYTGYRIAGVTGAGGFTEAHGGIVPAQGMAHGGISGAQGGGPRGNFTLVGEQGPEIVDLAPGSNVFPAGATRNILENRGNDRGHITISFERSGDPAIDALINVMAKRIRARWSGDVVGALSQ